MQQQLILRLHAIGAIQHGSFALRKDFIAPFQIDLKKVMSHPQLAKQICEILWEKAQHLTFDFICGTPVLGQLLATYISLTHDIPLVIRRTDAKKGQPSIEGIYKSGQKCLVIGEGLIAGTEVLDTVDVLIDEGLEVRDTLNLVDFELGGKKKIKLRGFSPHSSFSVTELMQILFDAGKIPGDAHKLISDFLKEQKKSGKNGLAAS